MTEETRTDTGEEQLWREYRATKSLALRNRLIELYAPLVKYLAGRLAISMPPSVEEDDLIGYGVLGLIDAIDKFDPAREVKFRTYASTRIRGAILDELRAFDWIPRTVHQRARQLSRAYLELENRLGHSPTDQEVAAHLNLTLDEFNAQVLSISGTTVLSMDSPHSGGPDDDETTVLDSLEGPAENTPDRHLEREDMKRVLAEGVRQLPEKEQQVVYLYYYEELTLKEIGEVLGVTESRVSQLHTKAMLRLRTILQKNIDAFTGPMNE